MSRPRPGGPIPLQEVEAVNERFCRERESFNLSYRCEDCEHYDDDKEDCSMHYPTEAFGPGPHRCRGERGELVFCKYFEVR